MIQSLGAELPNNKSDISQDANAFKQTEITLHKLS